MHACEAAPTQALVENYYSIEMFWYPLNKASIAGFNPVTWDPYADRLMVFKTQRAAATPGGPAPVQYSDKPNLASNLETFLGATINNVGIHTGNLAVQARCIPGAACRSRRHAGSNAGKARRPAPCRAEVTLPSAGLYRAHVTQGCECR